ncbi:MAG: hypothetical protein IJ506_06405 [Clostridia bacterium]|nr:hypothetical protein [Clostridia bacterium]
MTEEKLRKVITAAVVAATVLLVLLLVVIIYQIVTISVLDSREEKLEKENKQLQQVIDQNEQDAAYYESVLGQEWLAFKEGFIKDQGNK